MEKSLIHSNELHFISKKRIHQAVEKWLSHWIWLRVPQPASTSMQ